MLGPAAAWTDSRWENRIFTRETEEKNAFSGAEHVCVVVKELQQM